MKKSFMFWRFHRIAFPLAGLLAVLPMLLRGPSCGHDFDFHLLSWLEAATQFAHGGWPHWAYTPAWNAGEPRFIFYPPLSWALGGLLGLMLPWTLVPAVFTWICLTLSGIAGFRLASRFGDARAATLAATLYMLNPYMLFTAYERTAYGELMAAASMPLLFAAALATRVRVLPVAMAVALLWLTNAPAAVMGCYALAFITLIRLARPARRAEAQFEAGLPFAVRVAAGTLLGLALASFYIIPAAFERRFVQVEMAVTTGMRVSDHFLFHHMPGHSAENDFHDAVVRTASVVALVLLAAIFAAYLAARRKSAHDENLTPSPVAPLGALAILIAFLLTPPSAFLWRVLPQLHFLQFPWRLCALLAVVLCIFCARAIRVSWTPARTLVAALLLAATLITPSWLIFHQTCDEEDAVPARVALFHSNLGTEPTDEYTPANADPDALHPHDPPYWFIPLCAESTPDCDPNHDPAPNVAPGQAPNHLVVTVRSNPELLTLNRRAYPAWRISVDHQTYQLWPKPAGLREFFSPSADDRLTERRDGLLQVVLNPGTHVIGLTFIQTPDRAVGLALSGTSLFLTLLVAFRLRNRPSPVHTS